MQKNARPILTIGMIFKNEIRCLERCMKSLNPLREAVSCELIMADTGSDDGSREVAERYADILFDFPWIDDFAAARNAVMDQASGMWYLSIDADEYLDPDISQLTKFLQNSDKFPENICGITIRNYMTSEQDKHYSDFIAVRILRMSTGLRFEGAIHEAWPLTGKSLTTTVRSLSHTLLHHDGYVEMNETKETAKRKRNLALLRKELEKEPERLRTLIQYIESGRNEADYVDIVKRAVAVVEGKKGNWKELGAIIFRYAIRTAAERNLPEFEDWLAQAEKLFPRSVYIKIDVEYLAFLQAMERKEYTEAICRGERYLNAVKKYRKNEFDQSELLYGALLMESPYWEENARIFLASAYIKEKDPGRARELLDIVDATALDESQTRIMLQILGDLHCFTTQDTAPALLNFFQGIESPEPSKIQAAKRLDMFLQTAILAFTSENQMEEQQNFDFCRLGYTLFLPLREQCEVGRAAAILASNNLDEIQSLLMEVKKWEEFPIEALTYAIKTGLTFPLPEKALTMEEMDRLAGQLAIDKNSFYSIVRQIIKEEFDKDWQTLAWARGLALATIRIYDWKQETSDGLEFARFFASVEKKFLTRYYSPELLCEENLVLLPVLHRFGWHCTNAFQELDAGNYTGYVQELRAGLDTCREMKPMVEFLIETTPELQKQTMSAELESLAEQIRILLSAYPAGSPEIVTLKASPAYQKVAWLIEKKDSSLEIGD